MAETAKRPIIEAPLTSLSTSYERFRLVRPREYALMSESLKKFGQISPATAGRVADDAQRYEVIDGFKRYRACVELGMTSMKIQLLEGGAHALKAALIQLNRSQGTLHAFEEALVVRSLYREDLLDQQQIAVLFGRHKSWACRRIALCERLCEEAIEHVRLGLVGFATARELWQLPRGNQPAALACVLKHRLNCRETAQLVSRLLQSPQWEHDNILHLPLDILDSRCAPRPSQQVYNVARILQRLCAALRAASMHCEALRLHTWLLEVTHRETAVKQIETTAGMLADLKTALLKG